MELMSRKGFTLVELLVVITIMGILVSLGTFGFSTAQKKARDAQRKNDLKEIKQALEAYAGANNGLYPGNTGTGCSYNDSGIFAATGSLAPYLPDPSKIDDPKFSSAPYMYVSYVYLAIDSVGDLTKSKSGVFYARLEGEASDKALLVVCTNGRVKQVAPPETINSVCGGGVYYGLWAGQVCAGQR